MVVETPFSPKAFAYIKVPCRWFELSYDGGKVYGWLALQPEPPNVGVHLQMRQWSPSIAKQMIADWPLIVDCARRLGGRLLWAANENYTDKRWPKLIRHFGFPEPRVVSLSMQEI